KKAGPGSMPDPVLIFGRGEGPAGGGASWCQSFPVLAGPDELEAFLSFHLGKRCVDRGREARIVELDREVVATLLGDLLPGCAELNVAGVDTELGGLVGGILDPGDA